MPTMADGAATNTTSDALATLRHCYVANLAALYRVDPATAANLDRNPVGWALPTTNDETSTQDNGGQSPPDLTPATLTLEPTRDGNTTVQLTSDDGKPVYAHSRYRPREEAEKLIATLPESETSTFVVLGAGLGYHVLALEARYREPVLIIAEPDLALLQGLLCHVDLSAAIRGGRVVFLTDAAKSHVHSQLHRLNTDMMMGLQFVQTPLASRVKAAFHTAIREQVQDFVAFGRVQMVTLLKNARITVENVVHNVADYAASPGIETIENKAAGYPAIVVAAGPSLSRNIDQLAAYADKAVIIAVQTVYRSLVERGIHPHFVTSLDFHETSANFFRCIDDMSRTVMVAEPKANWNVLDVFTGEKLILSHKLHPILLSEHDPKHGGLVAGSTVAHLAFYVAQHVGCNPIMFLGQDLSFTEAMYYAPGMDIENIWAPELSRYNTIENKQWERIIRSRNILHPCTDLHGRPAYTDDQMKTYSQQFEADFAQAPQTIIQASEGGLALGGMIVRPFAEAATEFCTKPLPEDWLSAVYNAQEPSKDDIITVLQRRMEEVARVGEIASRTTSLLEELEQLVADVPAFNRVVAKVDALRSEMQQYDEAFGLVVSVVQRAEFQRYSADRQLGKVAEETAETAKRRLRRDRDYVAGLIEGAQFLGRILPDALQRVEQKLGPAREASR